MVPSEIRDIVISVIVLAMVFSYPEFISSPESILFAFLAVGLGFIGHELSHKFVAQGKGYKAAYKMWPQGLLLAILFAVVSRGEMVFAAPGAVYFAARQGLFQRGSKKDIGLIGIAGVVFNFIMYGIFTAVFLFTGNVAFQRAAFINIWLALFNLIPFPPLDGSKVFSWNPVVWGAAFVLALAGLFL